MQNLLLDTNKDILPGTKLTLAGVGPYGKGGNRIGKYMTEIRKLILTKRLKRCTHWSNRYWLRFSGQGYILMLAQMRVNDMCRIISIMRNYSPLEHNIDQDLTSQFVTNVFWTKCTNIVTIWSVWLDLSRPKAIRLFILFAAKKSRTSESRYCTKYCGPELLLWSIMLLMS
jgi:hypothetical protein